MPAIIIVPTATTVAGDDPETAAKKVQAKTEAIASPPLICPTQATANLINLLATPPVDMIVPPKMKNGIAIKV